MKIYLNEHGITVGKLKELLSQYDDETKVTITQYENDTLYSCVITEAVEDTNNDLTLISKLTREQMEND